MSSALSDIAKRQRDTARGGGTGAAIGGGLTAAALGGAALKYRKPLQPFKAALKDGSNYFGIPVSSRELKAATAAAGTTAVATGAGLGSAPGAAIGRKRRNPGRELNSTKMRKGMSTMDGTNVQWLNPRSPSGKFVSHENDLKILIRGGGRKIGTSNSVERFTGGGVKKSLHFSDTGRVGRRIPVEKASVQRGLAMAGGGSQASIRRSVVASAPKTSPRVTAAFSQRSSPGVGRRQQALAMLSPSQMLGPKSYKPIRKYA